MADSMSVLLTSGADAFANLYDVEIYFPDSEGKLETMYTGGSVRAMSFTPPELVPGEYKAAYKGVSLTRYNAKITGAREFTIDFRSDANYDLLKKLNEWKTQVIDPNGEGLINFGAFSDDRLTDNPMYGKIVVKAYKATSTNVSQEDTDVGVKWTFTQVICMNIGSPALSRGSTDPTRISAKFMFMQYSVE